MLGVVAFAVQHPRARGRHRRRAAGRSGWCCCSSSRGWSAAAGGAGRGGVRRPPEPARDGPAATCRRPGAPRSPTGSAALWAGRPVIIGPVVLAGFDAVRRVVPRPRLPGARGRHQPRRGPAPRRGQLRGGHGSTPPATASLTEELRTPRPDGPPAPRRRCAPRSTRSTRSAAGIWYTTPVRHHRRADRRPAGHRRPAGVVPGPRGQDAGRRRSGTPPGSSGRRTASSTWPTTPALDAATAELGGDAGRGVGRRRPRRLQRRRQLRALAARRPRPGRGAGVLPAALRPGAGDAVPRGRAVLDPRVRAAGRHGGAAAGRDRDPARPGDAGRSTYCGLGTTWDPPPADREAMRAAARRVGAHLQRDARLPRRVRHRRRAHRRRVPAHRAQHPDVGGRHRR